MMNSDHKISKFFTIVCFLFLLTNISCFYSNEIIENITEKKLVSPLTHAGTKPWSKGK